MTLTRSGSATRRAVDSGPTGTDDDDLESMTAALARMDLGTAPDDDVRRCVQQIVMHADYPCLGAKSAFRTGGVHHLVLRDMDDASTATQLLAGLVAFAAEVAASEDDGRFRSLVVSFRGPVHGDEASFERSLYRLLDRVAASDASPWADGVSADPTDPHFAFSAGGTAYFVVGLHPDASRVARRAPLPTLVFNLHEQFERLRREGRFERMRSRIRSRDEMLQGSVNPMVADHGDASEARQYSGRWHDADWVAPLHLGDPAPPPPADPNP